MTYRVSYALHIAALSRLRPPEDEKCCWHSQKLVKINLPEIWSQRSSQDWFNLVLSFHAQLPIPAALKLVERSAACTSPSEDADALSGACCQKGSMSHYLLRLHRSTLRPVCQQPTMLRTEKVQDILQNWCDQLDDVMFQAPMRLRGAGNHNGEVSGNPSSLSSLSAPSLCASACRAWAWPALHSSEGSQEGKAGCRWSSVKLLLLSHVTMQSLLYFFSFHALFCSGLY